MNVDLQALRERAGMSRQALAESMNWTVSKIWRVETGKLELAGRDLDAVKHFFRIADDVNEDGEFTDEYLAPRARIQRGCPEGAVRSTEWNGLQYGDTVRIRGDQGRYTFRFHHKDDRQEYVELWGPTKSPGMRSILPERVILKKSRRNG